jgi:hypothetical protein
MTLSKPTVSVDFDQLQHLQDIAQRQGHSLNETLHEVIHLGINALQHRKQKHFDALNHPIQIRQDIDQAQGKYPSHIPETIREERMQSLNINWVYCLLDT